MTKAKRPKNGRRKKGGSAQGWVLFAFFMACSLFFAEQVLLKIYKDEWNLPAYRWNITPNDAVQPQPTEDMIRLPFVSVGEDRTLEGVYPEVKEGFLPICFGKVTDEKVVALTIDDCNQPDNLRMIVDIIDDCGGKATIFPIGENVESIGSILKSVVQRGFEIENHTQSHAGLYEESDSEMAYQIWQQNAEVSRALGVDYQMHFLRPRGGDNRYDQRTHAYMRQLGYYGIAYWSQVGTGATADEVMRNLQPGDIILFHTTDQDLETLIQLVPRLYSEGYRMVTLNELYGIPDNEQSAWNGEIDVPALEPYERFDQTLKRGDYIHDVLLMQRRLEEMGFMSGSYNGYFGAQTEKAVMAFQERYGLTADGLCGPATWRALFEQ